MRVGTVTSWTVIGTQFATGNLRKNKVLAGTAVWNGTSIVSGNLRKNKKLSGTAVWSGANYATGNLRKNKKLSGTATWHGAQYATGNILVNKKLSGAASWTGPVLTTGNLTKHKKLSGTAIWTGPVLATGNLTKNKLLSGSSTYNGSLWAGAAASDNTVGFLAWSSTANAVGPPDASFATCIMGLIGDVGEYLKTTQYGFAIPGGATIDGVEARVFRRANILGGTCKDSNVVLSIAGAPSGLDHANPNAWAASVEEIVYGGPTDLWGLTLIPSDINDSGFGFCVAPIQTSVGSATAEITAVGIKIYYH